MSSLSNLSCVLKRVLEEHYKWRTENAIRRLRSVPLSEARVRLDFKSLHITPKNFVLYLNPLDEGLSPELYAWGFREPVNTFLLHKFIKNERENIDAVIDIGSNIGYFPLVEIASDAKQIIAIEPIKESFFILKKNLEKFRNVKMLNVAISDKNQILKMVIPEKRNWARVLQGENEQEMHQKITKVHAFPLKEIISSEGLMGANILVRMDVEGFEEVILKDIPKEVHYLSFELHSREIGFHGSLRLLKKLSKLNYRIKIASRYAGTRAAICPLIKWFGLRNALLLHQKLSPKVRLASEHEFNYIINWIKQKEAHHIFAIKTI